jgi:hypothetical protein
LLSATDSDWYRLSLSFPTSLTAFLQGEVAPASELRLYGSAGELLARAGPGLLRPTHAAFGPVKAGNVFLEVRSPTGATGAYTLVARSGPCAPIPGAVRPQGQSATEPPAFSDRKLLLSEVMYAPVASTGDPNGDGVVDATDDEFVELYNPTGSVLDLGGISISDSAAVRFTFPCGVTLRPRTATVIFGGGAPFGDFGGSTVWNARSVSRTTNLSLNNDGDTVNVTDPAGNLLDSFSWPTLSACGNVSCALDLDGGGQTLVKHTTIPGAAGSFSPGRKPNGALFAGAIPPPANDLCGGAEMIPVDLSQRVTVAGDASGATDNYASPCGLPGREVAYIFSPAAPVSLDLFPSGAVRSLTVKPVCDRSSMEIACREGPLSVDQIAPGSYALFVEADGPFTVGAEFGSPRTPAANIACASPIDLSSGGTHAGNTRAGGLAYDSPCTTETDAEPALWYQIALPGPRRLRIAASATWKPTLTLLSGCSGRAVACGESALEIPSLPAGDWRLAVSGRGPRDGDSGAFDLSVTVETAVPTPAGDQCEGAPAASGTLVGESTAGAADHYTPPPGPACAALPATPGPDVVYAVPLGSGQMLTATATPKSAGLDLVLYVVSSCLEVGTCLAGTNAAGPGGAETVTYSNPGPAQTVYLVVDGPTAESRGVFDLQIQVQ